MSRVIVFLCIIALLPNVFAAVGDTCTEEQSANCDSNADCNLVDTGYDCICPPGMVGTGELPSGCDGDAYTIRLLYRGYAALELSTGDYNDLLTKLGGITCTVGTTSGCDHVTYMSHGSDLGVNVLFTKDASAAAASAAATLNGLLNDGKKLSAATGTGVDPDVGARTYSWSAGNTGSPMKINPSGMEVTFVQFETPCATAGCWVIDVDFTVGHSDVAIPGLVTGYNTFYLPFAPGSDDLSFDYQYTSDVLATFQPKNFPCRVSDYTGTTSQPTEATMCCFGTSFTSDPSFPFATKGTGLLGNYRTTTTFVDFADDTQLCPSNVAADPNLHQPADTLDVSFWKEGTKFYDMPDSPGIVWVTATDAYVGMYKAVIKLDEVELRRKAALLTGTVGVEHTLDFFLGWANFKPATGSSILDSLAAQTNIHVEKTSFFTVSTHGTNEYTFLEYVNMRLVTIYQEDTDDSGTAESADRTVRTDPAEAADYVQVTFTLESKFSVAPDFNANPLIPTASVRAGKGTFFEGATLVHKCMEYKKEDGYTTASSVDPYDMKKFDSRLGQTTCAPAATMCASPQSIPDSFVSFNIPLGVGWFPSPSKTLSENVFVDMVIAAYDAGSDPMQVTTTLTASIPVVEGGINIFCDKFTAKTDLKDVANVDMIVGSAKDASELSRLRIVKDIASTQLGEKTPSEINTDSIEDGLMTLVLKGNVSYFGVGNPGRGEVSLELEDVITIHIMEDTGAGTDSTKDKEVAALIAEAPSDNQDENGLITDGYGLNGAFYFRIDRSSQRAHLMPTDELTALCPFNPPRPASVLLSLETCVTRRDVRFRNYPWRQGAYSTAMEICAGDGAPCPTSSNSAESKFMTTILGDNDYARELALDFAETIKKAYDLNGRYRRAFWINPGYEWTPTQTGGASPFQISQKLYLFALVTLDERISTDRGDSIVEPVFGGFANVGPNLPSRRRMLLQTVNDRLTDGRSQLGGEKVEFNTSPTSLMAKAFGVPEDKVVTLEVNIQLTQEEACLTPEELQASLRLTLEDYVRDVASRFETVQVTKLKMDPGSVQCRRRGMRALFAASDASAEVTLLIVFAKGDASTLSIDKLATKPGIASVDPIILSPRILTADVNFVPTPAPEEGGSNTPVIIGAVVGGAGGLIVLGAAYWFFRKREPSNEVVLQAVQTVSLQDLKSQLQNEV